MRSQKLQKFVFLFFVALSILSISAYAIWGDGFSLENIRGAIQDFGVWSPIIFITLYAFGTVFLPSTPFMTIAGVLFGFKYGFLYSIIGGLISATIVFFVSRMLGKTWVDRVLQNKHMRRLDRYNKRLEGGGLTDLIVLRIAPIMPFNILNILMGVSNITIRNYIIGTMIGLIPSILLTVYFGTFITKIF